MGKRIMKYSCLYLWFVLITSSLHADVQLPSVIGDHMVIQQNSPILIWGWADAGEEISVKGNWQVQSVHTVADKNNSWSVLLESPPAGGPYDILIEGKNRITLNDILAGEVWLASGQSNMAMPLKSCANGEAESRAAKYKNIRLFHVEHISAQEPQTDCMGAWKVCTPAEARDFSGVAYFFGRSLYQELEIPIGLISASKGGSPAEAWMNKDSLAADPSFIDLFAMWKKWEQEYPEDSSVYRKALDVWQKNKISADSLGKPVPEKPHQPVSVEMIERPHRRPGALYNGMLAPILPFRIKGVIWYQGENNVDRPMQYRKLFPALIENWRSERRQAELPFFYVQIAPFRYSSEKKSASLLREAQTMTLALPNTGMVVTADIGNIDDVHPGNKQDVGKRLALWALAKTYGENQIIYSGPTVSSIKKEDNRIRVLFDHAETGLVVKDESLKHFEIAGENHIFYPAIAEIEDTTIVVYNQKVINPLAVRYGWDIDTIPDLYNGAGLPAVPFRTDNWE